MKRLAQQFWLILTMQAKQAVHHPYAALATTLTWMIRVGITLIFYQAVYHVLHTTNIRGLDFNITSSSMVLYTLLMSLSCRQINEAIKRDYINGDVALWLNKPVPYIMLKIATVLGQNLLASLGVIICVICYWASGHFPVVQDTAQRLVAGGALLLLGLLIGYCLYTIIGFTSFWLGSSDGPWLVADKLVMVFGGIYIPVAFFPPGLRLVGECLPMGAMTFFSQIFFPDFFERLPRFLTMQVFWLVSLALILTIMNRRVTYRLTVNGG